MQGKIESFITNGIARLYFGNPQSNSLSISELKLLTKEINDLSTNPNIKVIVLGSKGDRAFCAGASLRELVSIDNQSQGEDFFMGFANVINAMRLCLKPIIGRIQGKSVGGGVGLISACDLCFASEDAYIKLSELSIGFGPFVIEPAVVRKIGKIAFSDMALQPTQWKSPQWAYQRGMYNEVFGNSKQLDEHIQNIAFQLCQYNCDALEALKKINWEGTEHWEKLLKQRAQISGKLVLSEFTKDALAKYTS